MDTLEKKICEVTQGEGIGSVYERIMVNRFFGDLEKKIKFDSVLEFGCEITKGLDNIAILRNRKVVIADKEIDGIKKRWGFKEKPIHCSFKELNGRFDLVWNFAVIQVDPKKIKKMKKYSNKYVLIFTPNIYNPGTLIHWGYHFLSRRKCVHAERGKKMLRTLGGLKKFIEKNGLNIIDSGFIDMPPIPDIGFSIKELKDLLGIKKGAKNESPKGGEELLRKVEKMSFIEKNRFLPNVLKQFISHHHYVLAETRD